MKIFPKFNKLDLEKNNTASEKPKNKIIHNHENFKYIILYVNQCFYFELFDMFKSEGGQS